MIDNNIKVTEGKRYLTVSEIANMLSLTKGAVYAMIYRRQIPYIKIGQRRIRFDSAEIENWLAKQEKITPIENDKNGSF